MTKTAADTHLDVYSKITNHVIAALEAGAGKWHMSWHTDAATNLLRPVNVVTGRHYRGVNTLTL